MSGSKGCLQHSYQGENCVRVKVSQNRDPRQSLDAAIKYQQDPEAIMPLSLLVKSLVFFFGRKM